METRAFTTDVCLISKVNMEQNILEIRIKEFLSSPTEIEWVEFKHNFHSDEELGKWISALSNAARLHHQETAYFVFGIEDATHRVVGTTFRYRTHKIKGQELENWLANYLEPRIDIRFHELQLDGNSVLVLEIPATKDRPVRFNRQAYIRVGSATRLLSDFPEKEKSLWSKPVDWSAQICAEAELSDLSADAIAKARLLFSDKYPHLATQMSEWSDEVFLNKAKLSIKGKITNTALLLL